MQNKRCCTSQQKETFSNLIFVVLNWWYFCLLSECRSSSNSYNRDRKYSKHQNIDVYLFLRSSHRKWQFSKCKIEGNVVKNSFIFNLLLKKTTKTNKHTRKRNTHTQTNTYINNNIYTMNCSKNLFLLFYEFTAMLIRQLSLKKTGQSEIHFRLLQYQCVRPVQQCLYTIIHLTSSYDSKRAM
jgi:hypothetical protein